MATTSGSSREASPNFKQDTHSTAVASVSTGYIDKHVQLNLQEADKRYLMKVKHLSKRKLADNCMDDGIM